MGLYSRGCLATNQGLNGENSRAEFTGVSRIEEQLTHDDVTLLLFFFLFIFFLLNVLLNNF